MDSRAIYPSSRISECRAWSQSGGLRWRKEDKGLVHRMYRLSQEKHRTRSKYSIAAHGPEKGEARDPHRKQSEEKAALSEGRETSLQPPATGEEREGPSVRRLSEGF